MKNFHSRNEIFLSYYEFPLDRSKGGFCCVNIVMNLHFLPIDGTDFEQYVGETFVSIDFLI